MATINDRPHYIIDEAKMTKLIDFLITMPRKDFNFEVVVSKQNNKGCGTVCCAIGWTPIIFPKEAKWSAVARFKDHANSAVNGKYYALVASDIFGMSDHLADHLFAPDSQEAVHRSLPNAGDKVTPKKFAKVLKKFMELVTYGLIPDHGVSSQYPKVK